MTTEVYALHATTLGISRFEGTVWDDAVGIAAHDGELYAAETNGLYLNSGTTDDGDDIDAYVQTGQDVYGDATREKYFEQVLLYGVAADGIAVTTVVWQSGTETEYDYESAAMAGDENLVRRVKFGGGVRGTSWGLRIGNIDGGAFSLRNVEGAVIIGNKRR